MIILIGISGAGKTLQGELLAQREGYISLSMGKLLRDHADPETKKLIEQGVWLDQHTTGRILRKALAKYNLKNVVLDGYPRTKDQAEWLAKHYKKGDIPIEKVILLDADTETVIERMGKRGRTDDTESAIKKRLQSYFSEIDGVIACLDRVHIKLERIDASGDVEAVYSLIHKALEGLINDKSN